MTTTRNLVLCFALISFPLGVFGQADDCETTLNRAVDEFNAGHFYAIPMTLERCLDQFSREQRQRAYLLLTQTYLLLDDPIGSRQSYLALLDANPEFVPDTSLHPIDVIYLSKRFTATSIFSWFVKAGANTSIPRVINDVSAFGVVVHKKYYLSAGYQLSGGIELNLAEKVDVRAELLYLQAAFRQEKVHFERDNQLVNERQSWFSLPVTLVYRDNVGKYRPFGYVGYSLQYLVGSRTEITLTNDKPDFNSESGDREQTRETSPALISRFKRNPFNQALVFGGGVKLKVGLDFLFVDLCYTAGLRNVTSARNRYANYGADPLSAEFVGSTEASIRYGHVDDDYRLDNICISLGFLRPLYKPRELKRARTRSVMRQMNK